MGVFAASGQARTLRVSSMLLRALRDGALYRERRNYLGALPGDIQEQLLRRHLAESVVGTHTSRTG
jgi:hypothetical protein